MGFGRPIKFNEADCKNIEKHHVTLNEFIDVLLITVSIIVVVPLTFKFPSIFPWFKVDWPDTFKDDDNLDEPETYKLLKSVLLFKLFIDDNVDVENVENVVVST